MRIAENEWIRLRRRDLKRIAENEWIRTIGWSDLLWIAPNVILLFVLHYLRKTGLLAHNRWVGFAWGATVSLFFLLAVAVGGGKPHETDPETRRLHLIVGAVVLTLGAFFIVEFFLGGDSFGGGSGCFFATLGAYNIYQCLRAPRRARIKLTIDKGY
jgi:hypothetical protein